jgi:hypothetical protein
MRIIIAGGRTFTNYQLLKEKCFDILRDLTSKDTILNNKELFEIVSGTARGADQLGERFAKEFGFKVIRFPADWDTWGKSAGYRRNEAMAKYAKEDNGILIATWDGQSKGTKHMIDLANKYGLKVYVVNY